jgi:hypothetical protein
VSGVEQRLGASEILLSSATRARAAWSLGGGTSDISASTSAQPSTGVSALTAVTA